MRDTTKRIFLLVAFFSFFHLILFMQNDRRLLAENLQNEQIESTMIVKPTKQNIKNIPVFYNLYVSPTNKSDIPRVEVFVKEQLANLQSYHRPVYIHSIGSPLPIPNTTLLGHHRHGTEMITLHSLWKYCQNHTDEKVVYLHSKGSFHNRKENDKLRKFMTLGAVSTECSNNLPLSCDVCSSRFAPYPHPHTSGNMWLSRCSYVTKLIDPLEFMESMEHVPLKTGLPRRLQYHLVGRGRFAAEHWINSHPSGQPCDLYTGKFSCGYDNIPEDIVAGDFDISLAPRFQWQFYKPLVNLKPWTGLRHRLREYKVLYNKTPASSWWGWRLQEWIEEKETINSELVSIRSQ